MRVTSVLYVHRDFVGIEFPFDKVYFFHKNDEAELPRVFANAIVLPLSKHFTDFVERVISVTAGREGVKWAEVTPKYKPKYKTRGFNRIRDERQALENAKAGARIRQVLSDRKRYVALVPILFTKQRPREHVHSKTAIPHGLLYPQYLGAARRRKMDTPGELLQAVVGPRAYFIYRSKVYRPLCLLCPRSIDSVVGDCKLGSEECFINLGRVGKSDFQRGVEIYNKLAKQIDEPELGAEEVVDA